MAEQVRIPDSELSGAGKRALVPPPQRRHVPVGRWVLLAGLLALAAGGWWWYRDTSAPTAPQPQAGPTLITPPASVPASSAAQASAGPASAALLPEPQVAEEPIEANGVAAALSTLFGAPGMQWLIVDDFVQRFVVTVDNLAREHSAPRLWPVRPTPGRFQVIEREGRLYADPDNAARYTPLVLLVEQADAASVVALYGRLLPQLQSAYEQLGYPGQRFHARLMAVIDHLLATPDAPELIPLTLVEVKGEVPSARPWLRYEFADASLESASAGQKILLRVGAVNERRLKATLRALRAELLRQAQR